MDVVFGDEDEEVIFEGMDFIPCGECDDIEHL